VESLIVRVKVGGTYIAVNVTFYETSYKENCEKHIVTYSIEIIEARKIITYVYYIFIYIYTWCQGYSKCFSHFIIQIFEIEKNV